MGCIFVPFSCVVNPFAIVLSIWSIVLTGNREYDPIPTGDWASQPEFIPDK